MIVLICGVFKKKAQTHKGAGQCPDVLTQWLPWVQDGKLGSSQELGCVFGPHGFWTGRCLLKPRVWKHAVPDGSRAGSAPPPDAPGGGACCGHAPGPTWPGFLEYPGSRKPEKSVWVVRCGPVLESSPRDVVVSVVVVGSAAQTQKPPSSFVILPWSCGAFLRPLPASLAARRP